MIFLVSAVACWVTTRIERAGAEERDKPFMAELAVWQAERDALDAEYAELERWRAGLRYDTGAKYEQRRRELDPKSQALDQKRDASEARRAAAGGATATSTRSSPSSACSASWCRSSSTRSGATGPAERA